MSDLLSAASVALVVAGAAAVVALVRWVCRWIARSIAEDVRELLGAEIDRRLDARPFTNGWGAETLDAMDQRLKRVEAKLGADDA